MTWIDTEKGEDILQVGIFNTWVAFKTWIQISLYRLILMVSSGPAYQTKEAVTEQSTEGA
ncbi:hypothetical protein B6A42_19015 [Vibrio coralliilyticus]|jgi:hypothetical protein|nr:hypothetical protein B6A42_19015 [Vibrio coralliilyticus]